MINAIKKYQKYLNSCIEELCKIVEEAAEYRKSLNLADTNDYELFYPLFFKIQTMMNSMHNNTQQKEAEIEIFLLGHTLNSLHECVIITDLNNIITSVNPAMLKLYGYTIDEVIGQNVMMLRTDKKTWDLTEQILAKTFQDGWEGELINRKKNGEIFPIHLSTSVVRNEEGTPIALVGITRDITEQKNLQHQLEETTRVRSEDLRYFSTSIQHAQEEERRRIARELHDGLSQRLSGMKLHLELLLSELRPEDKKSLQRVKKIKKQINDMITETHRISVNLHPTALDDFGLTVALQLLFKDFQGTFNIPITYYPSISTHEHFDRQIEIALYRITQEALNNIVKHAKATAITIRFTRDIKKFVLSIEDNGIGFNYTSIRGIVQGKRGLGLISMKERTENVGGTFEMTSIPQQGTTILIQVPVQQ